jgi:hypothetical protein
MTIEIGGTAIGLKLQDTAFHQQLENRYSNFLTTTSPPQFSFEVQVAESLFANPEAVVTVRRDGDSWFAERGDFRAQWHPGTGKGVVTLRSPSLYAIDSILRIVHSIFLAQDPPLGFLLHAASAIRRDHAFLFSGLSGAGKTTISRLAPADVALLSDEISYICRSRGTFSAVGTPFAGELARPGENQSAPIRALFFLEKGLENRIASIEPAEASRRLLRNVLFFADDKALIEGAFGIACDFVSMVPVHRLIFVPDQRVWDIIG